MSRMFANEDSGCHILGCDFPECVELSMSVVATRSVVTALCHSCWFMLECWVSDGSTLKHPSARKPE